MAHGQVAGLGEPELQAIHKLCLPERDEDFNTNTLRPERPEYATLVRAELNQGWIRSLRTIQGAVFKKLDIPQPYDGWLFPNGCLFLISTAAILFDQECSSAVVSDPRTLPPLGPHEILPGHASKADYQLMTLFDHMFLVDYGFGEHPYKEAAIFFKDYTTLPDFLSFGRLVAEFAYDCRNDAITKPYLLKASKQISRSLYWRSDRNAAEIAIMAYWLYTRRREISSSEYEVGLTGYTGVIQEMVSEIPEKGAGRLRRKLSVDVNELIPHFASRHLRELLIGAARDLAAQHGLSLTTSLENEGGVIATPCSCGTYVARDGSSPHLGSHESRPGSLSPREVTPPPSYEEAMNGQIH
ncbi:hypothetical protein KVR01_000717 [Diaporthe batatas]|uniref:uncharacterized protein n=1 Tax=Diaporthe batatas TaxID=748121 RepID=UPI001D047ADE|nr:uncharacterized protein KVR01_000717 [Diaporthe batatas]KAG8169972.1 hypothetical protein KVR01_000717 [Diaporthe batatas]